MRRLTILGGHRDGDVVPYAGPVLYLPAVRAKAYTPETAATPDGAEYEEYRERRDDDGRWWYVK